VFDADFFNEGTFLEAVQEFSRDHGDDVNRGEATLRVEIVTLTGDRLDTLQLTGTETGATLSTRDDRLVLVPYGQIAYIEVSVLQDHRIAGFRIPTSSE
jgi:hypothetical protein